jgi:hypothetical protein
MKMTRELIGTGILKWMFKRDPKTPSEKLLPDPNLLTEKKSD